MYTLDIICINGHPFEGWFSNRTSFERQRDGKFIVCPVCGDTSVQQALSAVRIKRHAEVTESTAAPENAGVPEKTDATAKPAVRKSLRHENILQFIEKNFEDVGGKFADEAIKIHAGEAERRNIRGTATIDEERQLAEEGVSFFKLPNFQ